QVHNHDVHAFLAQLLQQAGDDGGGGAGVRVAAAAGVEVGIEGRQLDHADAALDDLDDALLRRLYLQLDLVADDGDLLRLRIHPGFRRQDVQAHLGPLIAADQLHHVLDAPAEHVHHATLVALAYSDHAVADLEFAAGSGQAARDDCA